MTHKVSIHFCPKRYKIVKLYSRLSCVVGALESQIYLRVRSFGMIWIRIIDPRSLGSWYIKGTDESTMDKNSPVHLIYYDLNDLRSLILIQIISKERILKVPCLNPAHTTCWICFLVVTSSNA